MPRDPHGEAEDRRAYDRMRVQRDEARAEARRLRERLERVLRWSDVSLPGDSVEPKEKA